MIKTEDDIKDKNITKIKLQCNPTSTTSETYKFKVYALESGPKE